MILGRIRGLQDCLHLAALTALAILVSSQPQFRLTLINSGVVSLSMPFVHASVITGFTVLPSSMTEQSRFEDVPLCVPGHARTACKSTHTASLGSLRLALCRLCPILSCSCDGSLILSNWRLVILGSFSSPSNGVSIQTLWQITTESQGYLDELASDGKTTPRAPLTRSSTFRIKCGDVDVASSSREDQSRVGEDLGSEVVFWFVAHVPDHSPLPVPLHRR